MATGMSARLLAGLRRALTFWRRSIQARVVASTVVLSAVVISVVGWFLLQQTRDGLLAHRVAAVVAEAGNETRDARARLAAASGTDLDHAAQQRDLVEPIIASGESRGFGVVLAGPVGATGGRIAQGGAQFTPGLDTSSVPTSLEQHFARPAPTAWTYTSIRSSNQPGATRGLGATERALGSVEQERPGIVVGSQVRLPANGLTYTLYYLFPLDEDRETLALVTRALLTAAVLLLVLVAGLTWLVTRQVVTPVRLARQVAERLAAGQLQERLKVSGEDDLARLAASFNQMASSLQRQIRQLEELSRVQRRFVSDVSHELRTPLTTVRMAGDVLHDARRSFDPATARAAELLQVELDRFETLLADLLEISRFDAGAAVLEVGDVDLADVAHRVVDMTRALASSRGVTRGGAGAGAPLPGRGRRTAGRADRAQPGHQRHRPRRVGRRRRARARRRAGVRDRGPRPRRGPGGGGGGAGLQPVLACRPRAGPHQRGDRPGPVDRVGGHAPARRLAAGVGPAGSRRAVPADPAPVRRRRACGTARCRWCRPTSRSRSRERAGPGRRPGGCPAAREAGASSWCAGRPCWR